MIDLFQEIFQSTHEVRVSRMNLKHQTFGALERIKSKRLEKTEHDQVFFQKKFSIYA
jgi:hypothetical protein